MNLINKAAVKKFTLETLKTKRPHLADKMTRVSGQYFEDVNRILCEVIGEKIDNLQTSGKTIK